MLILLNSPFFNFVYPAGVQIFEYLEECHRTSYLHVLNVNLCFLQIRFFHKLGAMSAPVTDTEKLIWAVLEAERPTLRFSRTVLLLSCFDMLKIGGSIYLMMLVSAVNCMRNLL